MATSSVNSISLSPDLYTTVKQFSEATSLSVDTIAETALRYCFDEDPEFERIRALHLERAASLGLSPDEYAVRMVKEVRAELKAERRQSHP